MRDRCAAKSPPGGGGGGAAVQKRASRVAGAMAVDGMEGAASRKNRTVASSSSGSLPFGGEKDGDDDAAAGTTLDLSSVASVGGLADCLDVSCSVCVWSNVECPDDGPGRICDTCPAVLHPECADKIWTHFFEARECMCVCVCVCACVCVCVCV